MLNEDQKIQIEQIHDVMKEIKERMSLLTVLVKDLESGLTVKDNF